MRDLLSLAFFILGMTLLSFVDMRLVVAVVLLSFGVMFSKTPNLIK